MKTKSKIHWALLVGVAAVGFAVPAVAGTVMMSPVHDGSVTFVTGGIGLGQEKALEASAGEYNLEITNADKAGAFTADENFQIYGKDGRRLISVSDAGPLFYAKLPAGDYTIRAMEGGERTVRKVTVAANKSTAVHLIWKTS
ncbi:MAG: hypothetical protein P4M13_05115 [Alphaproteobacteria bacterium]|nr:hypothetical protein [Alphaproteobacteria bacterium]